MTLTEALVVIGTVWAIALVAVGLLALGRGE